MSDTPREDPLPPPTERIPPQPTEHIPPRDPPVPPPSAAEEPDVAPPGPGPVASPAPRASRMPTSEEVPALAAVALVVAVAALCFGALLLAATFDAGFEEEWKATIKIIGLSVFGGLSVGVGLGTNALFAAGLLLLAVILARRDVPDRRAGLVPIVGVGTLALATWLGFFTLLGVVVDVTELGDDFAAAFGVLLSDLATLVVLLVAGVSGYHLFRGARVV